MTERQVALVMAGYATLRIRVSIVTRCTNPRHGSYKDYGARGVTICSGWAANPESFLRDLGPRPSRLHSVERINNSAGYWCGHCEQCLASGRRKNCRWATAVEQANNRRSSIFVRWRGKKLTVPQWSKETGVPAATIYGRLKHGWPVGSALAAPVKQPRLFLFKGKHRRIFEIAALTGINQGIITHRVERGGDLCAPPRVHAKQYRINGVSRSVRGWSAMTGVPYQTIYGRIRRGEPIRKAIKK